MDVKNNKINFSQFWLWLDTLGDVQFCTSSQNKFFKVAIVGGVKVSINPHSTNKERVISKDGVEKTLERYNLIYSLKPSDYKGFSRSYLTVLFSEYLKASRIALGGAGFNNDTSTSLDDVYGTVKLRRGQEGFRYKLLLEFGSQCAITGCKLEGLLEAAHIVPHKEATNYHPDNGLLLRTDIHTLYDLGLIKINSKGVVVVSRNIRKDPDYKVLLHNKVLSNQYLTVGRINNLNKRFHYE
ncbi:MAG: HNH endonuclease [Endozoicomonadaceae bacterium]|nr:HNH endonuclease [Endozoicomonadaceae bacterium]